MYTTLRYTEPRCDKIYRNIVARSSLYAYITHIVILQYVLLRLAVKNNLIHSRLTRMTRVSIIVIFIYA